MILVLLKFSKWLQYHKNTYINELDNIGNKCNNAYHSAIKMESVDVKSCISNGSSKIDNIVRILKYKNMFAEGLTPISPEEVFTIKSVQNTVPCTYVMNDLNGVKTVGIFYWKVLQKINQNEFKNERVISWKVDKLYVKWRGYNNLFNNWIDKKDLVQRSEYFPKPTFLGANVKADLKNAANVDT